MLYIQKILIIIILFSAIDFVSAQNEVVLKKFMERKGNLPYEFLGYKVYGINPTTNIPYNVVVSRNTNYGNAPPGPPVLEFHQITSPSDTMPLKIFPGSEILVEDINLDGYSEIIVTKSISDYDTVFVYSGQPDWIDTINTIVIPNESQYDNLKAKCIGDINNDGFPDLILSANGYPGLLGNKGKIYIFLGPEMNSQPDTVLIGDSSSPHLGMYCEIADLNNDGLNDLIIKGANQSVPDSLKYTYVNIYWGLESGKINLSVNLQLKGPLSFGGLSCFDVNGDGIDDLCWIDRDSTNPPYYPYFGSIHFGGSEFSNVPDLRLESPFSFQLDGIYNAGDVNGDGYNDIIVTAPRATMLAGFIWIFSGGPNIDKFFDAGVGMSNDSYFGTSASRIGDVNGDGLGDIIVSAPFYYMNLDYKGYWAIFLGDSLITVTSVMEYPIISTGIHLFQNFPNPFNPITTIKFYLPIADNVELKIYNLVGQEIATLTSMHYFEGEHQIQWDASNLSSGIYFYKLKTSNYTETKKLLLLR